MNVMPRVSRSSLQQTALMARSGLSISPLAAVQLGEICFSEPARLDLCVYRGDSGRLRVNVTDPDGVPLDVSAATWDCDIRATADSPTVIVSMAVEPVDGSDTSVDVVLDAASSALLSANAVWDLQMTLGGAVTTLLTGAVTTTLDVSRT